MQCNFIFYLFVTCSLFFLEVVVKIFDYFWKSNSLFSKFCVNCLLMFYFVYCKNCALKDVNGACYCTCSVVVLRVPEMCFWPARTRKSLIFLRCIYVIDLVLKYGSDINEGNWLQLLFYFIVLMGIVAFVIGMRFFSCVSGFSSKFSRIALLRKRLQLDSKSDSTKIGLILGFLLENGYFVDFISVWSEVCKKRSIVILFWRHQFFSMSSLRVILVCSLEMLVLFSHRIS